jgi:hypothetical protein
MEISLENHEIEEAIIRYTSEKLGYPYDKLIMEKPVIEIKNIPDNFTTTSNVYTKHLDLRCCFDQLAVKLILEV